MDYISRLVFEGKSIRIGQWRCYPDSNLWAEENIAGHQPMIVFPRSAVQIQQYGRELFVTSPNQVVFYNKDQTYRRGLASRKGDICEYIYIEPEIVAEVQASLGIKPSDDINEPFSYSQGPCCVEAFLIQRFVCSLAADETKDPIFIEESFLSILPKLIADSEPGYQQQSMTKSTTIHARRIQVETAKEFMNRNFADPISLSDVATACESSVFHLSRIFKELMGIPIFRYLISLRLRTAFERIVNSRDALTDIALSTGFCNLSHMSSLFKREFGLSPSLLRKRKPTELIWHVLNQQSVSK